MRGFFFVALGGALGAMARYGVSLLPVRTEFPFLTLATNFLGAVLIGFLAAWAAGTPGVSSGALLFWKTGVCGGFTTFSTFSLEAVQLLEANKTGLAMGYVGASALLCLAGVWLGQLCAGALRKGLAG